MRSNSGSGKGSNTNNDPTLKDNAGKGGTGERDQQIAEQESFAVAADRGKPTKVGGHARGETGPMDAAPPIDID